MKTTATSKHGEIMPFFRTPYNYDRKEVSDATGTVCLEPTRTQQQFKEECDINFLMKRFGVTGEIPQNIRAVINDDFAEVFDFQTAMNTIRKGEEAFMQMPSGVRARFQNNPSVFVQWLSDEDNRPAAEKLGLVLPKPKEKVDSEPGGPIYQE